MLRATEPSAVERAVAECSTAVALPLLELELVEPSLMLPQAPAGVAGDLARAIVGVAD